jgi:signal recognition particle receptor subunit beta
LKDGVVLVDLPGQGDSNPARNRVAESYQQKADAIVIAMEIKRAVDNKIGDKILKKRLKQQVLMNGMIQPDSMVFVCTKSDVGGEPPPERVRH